MLHLLLYLRLNNFSINERKHLPPGEKMETKTVEDQIGKIFEIMVKFLVGYPNTTGFNSTLLWKWSKYEQYLQRLKKVTIEMSEEKHDTIVLWAEQQQSEVRQWGGIVNKRRCWFFKRCWPFWVLKYHVTAGSFVLLLLRDLFCPPPPPSFYDPQLQIICCYIARYYLRK